jgi:hypothetical protein
MNFEIVFKTENVKSDTKIILEECIVEAVEEEEEDVDAKDFEVVLGS